MSILTNIYNDIPDFMEDLEEVANLLLYGKRTTFADIEDEIWEIARQYEQAPIIGNIYNSLVFSYLNGALMGTFEALNLKIDYYINSICSSFDINGKEITCEDDLIPVLLEAYNNRDCDLTNEQEQELKDNFFKFFSIDLDEEVA